MKLKIGDKAPDFTAVSDDGSIISLHDFISRGEVILYFYPKDFSPGCTVEASAFRERWKEIQALGASVIGVSSDNPESHASFKQKCDLPYTLVTDKDSSLRRLFGVKGLLIPPRVTFVIDRQWIIRDIYNSQLNARSHVERALKVLREIKG